VDVWVLVREDTSIPYEYRSWVVGVYATPEAAMADPKLDAYRWEHQQRDDLEWWEASIRSSRENYDLTRYPVQ
jgi:hypothetical protein